MIAAWAELSPQELDVLRGVHGLSPAQADNMIENAIGLYGLPLGIATNFLINQRDYLIPLVIEEPSVVAAMSNAARLFRAGGGFSTSSDDPIMIGQIQLLDIEDVATAAQAILNQKAMLLAEADKTGGSIIRRGGGARDLEVRVFPQTSIGPMIVVHLLFDTREAMGANAINTAAEHLAPFLETLTGGRANLRILSNLTDRRKARAEGMIPAAELARGDLSGREAVQAIVEAGVFAEVDPYRATTHNKGIMNGIDAVLIATGNDWRAVEAGAHAFAARGGTYTSLTRWWQDDAGNLRGSIELPLAVGVVGGATRVHPVAQVALKILGIHSARELAEIVAAAGLAQNLAAIRALATEGIQQGHMRMHARQLAAAAGAADDEVRSIAQQMIAEGTIRLERARELVAEMRMRS
ncbi:MAG: hydroxymethylglutaryl-CoA reductase, degradative [Anaerolineae bacterium]|nr:hydroxymethylglutaryl-CoA reductase, degradative [Anaerolineae bacterium]